MMGDNNTFCPEADEDGGAATADDEEEETDLNFFSYMVRSLFDSEIFAIHNPDQDECPPLGPKSYL